MPPRKLSVDDFDSAGQLTVPLFKPLERPPYAATSIVSRINGIGMRFSITAFPEFVARVSRIHDAGGQKTVMTNLTPNAPTFAPSDGGGFWLFVSSAKGHSVSKWYSVARYFECEQFFVKSAGSGRIGWFEFVARLSFLSGVTMHLLTTNSNVLKEELSNHSRGAPSAAQVIGWGAAGREGSPPAVRAQRGVDSCEQGGAAVPMASIQLLEPLAAGGSYQPARQAVDACEASGAQLGLALAANPVYQPWGAGDSGAGPCKDRLFMNWGGVEDEDTRDTTEGLLALRGNALLTRFLTATALLSYSDTTTLRGLLEDYYSGLPSELGGVAMYLMNLPQLQYFGAAVTLEKAILGRLSSITDKSLPSFTRDCLSSIILGDAPSLPLSADTRPLICKVLELREAVLDPSRPVHASLVDTSSVFFLLVVNMLCSKFQASEAASAGGRWTCPTAPPLSDVGYCVYKHLELVASWISSMCVLAQDVDMLIAAGGCPDNRMGGLIESVTPFSFAPPCFLLSKGEEGMSGSSIACRLKSKLVVVQKFLGISDDFKCYSDICFERTQAAAGGLFHCIVRSPEASLAMLPRAQVSFPNSPQCNEDVPDLLRLVHARVV